MIANARTFLALASSGDVPEVRVEDPASAWATTRQALQAALEDEAVAKCEFVGPMGPSTLEQTMAQFGIGDVISTPGTSPEPLVRTSDWTQMRSGGCSTR